MRIGMLTTSYPRVVGGVREPAGSFVEGLGRGLAARGHELEVLAPSAREGRPVAGARWVRYAPRWLERTFYGAGALEALRHDPFAVPGAVTFPAALLRAARQDGRRWDAVIAHWAVPAGLVARYATPHLPRMVVVHGSDLALLERVPAGRQLARAAMVRAAVWTVSEAHARRLRRLGVAPALVAPLPAEAPRPRDGTAARRRFALGSGMVVLALGRLIRLKGHRHLVAAAAALGRGGVPVTVLIGGEGPERRALLEAAEAAGVDLRLPGWLVGCAKDDAFAAADVFVQPSESEGAPLAVREARLAGLPIVASAVGGIPELLGGRPNAFIVPPADAPALAAALTLARHCPRTAPAERPRDEALMASVEALLDAQGRTRRVPSGGS